MLYRKLKLTEDYPRLKELWEQSKMIIPPPLDMLPADGWVVTDREGLVTGALFMWLASNSNVAFIGFPIIDDNFRTEARKSILPTLFDKAETTATYLGYKYAMHYTPMDNLNEFLKDRGYVVGDTNISHLVKSIN